MREFLSKFLNLENPFANKVMAMAVAFVVVFFQQNGIGIDVDTLVAAVFVPLAAWVQSRTTDLSDPKDVDGNRLWRES